MTNKQKMFLISNICLLLVLILTISCKQKPSNELQAVNILTAKDSQKAQLVLDSIKKAKIHMNEVDQKYCELLQLKINDKNYQPIKTHRNQIDYLIDYFQQTSDKLALPDAYYMAGRIYYDLGDIPKALSLYQKAEKGVAEDDYALQGDILSQMAYIYQQCHLYDDAINTLQKAYIADSLNENKQNMHFDLRDIGRNYYLSKKYPKAIFYWKRGIAMTTDNVNLLKDFHYSLANVFIKLNDIKAAKYYMDKLANLPQNNWSQKGFYSFLLEYNRKTGNIKKATEYENWIADSGDVWAKRYVAEMRITALLSQANNQKCSQEWNKYRTYSDSISKITDIETIKRIEQLYNYKEKEKENKDLQEQNANKNIIIATISLLMVILIGCTYLAYTSLKQKKKILELKIDKYENLKKEHNERNIHELENAQTRIKNSNIYKELLAQIKTDEYSLNKKQWEELENTVNQIYIDFTRNLNSFYDVSEHELKVCLMIKIGITPTNIAKFTNRSKEAINSTRGRLYAKVFNKTASAPKWDEFIKSL